jgi:hypothetical protein
MASTPNDTDGTDLSADERTALHEAELGVEWLHRAHGHLLAFHHAVGHGMEHFDEAETAFRDAGHLELADLLRVELLPRGVVDGDRWSYDLVESFQHSFLHDATDFERAARDRVADGERHVQERAQERRWRRQAEEHDR